MRLLLKKIVDLQEKEQMRRRKVSMRLPLKKIVDLQEKEQMRRKKGSMKMGYFYLAQSIGDIS